MRRTAPAAGTTAGRGARLAVGVVGAGRAGRAIAVGLAAAGHTVVGVTASRTPELTAAALPGVPTRPAGEVAAAATLLLLAVPDDALPAVVADLAAGGSVRPGAIVVHVSGRYGTAVLAPLDGAMPIALHPAMTLPGALDDARRLHGAAFGVTASDALLPVAEALVRELGGVPVRVPEQARPAYHAALAHTSNHLVTLVADGADLLRRAGVADPAAVLGPLLARSLANALAVGDAALTGPVARGDAGTVAAHRRTLADADPGMAATYTALARRTVSRAVSAHRLDPADAARVLDALTPEDGPV